MADGLAPHPHYQHPVWWTIPTGIALLVTWLRARAPVAARGLVAGLWILALAQFSFLPLWMRYVREHGGTRGIHYTTVLSREEAFIDAACALGPKIEIENHTVMFPPAIEYIARASKACAGHEVRVCSGSCRGGPDTRRVMLRYADASARLAPP